MMTSATSAIEHSSPTGDVPAMERVDVLIIGAGLSGIGAAVSLKKEHPERSFLIVEAHESFGGTWWTHRYPGARSDSDLHTFGYSFKPWEGATIASAGQILDYLATVVQEYDLERDMRLRHRVSEATWSSADASWTVVATRTDTGETVHIAARFLWMNQGYYDHANGYRPDWAGLELFDGDVVHPQHWPDDLDVSGKHVIVIGSGATAASLIPALTDTAGHVTMLQRSPTYFTSRPRTHELAVTLAKLDVPAAWQHEIMRRQFIADRAELIAMSVDRNEDLRTLLIEEARRQLPAGYDVERHFAPRYRPLQQRTAAVPDGDLFATIREGRASVVTDTIDHFDKSGIVLTSGEHLDADVVVTATGLVVSLFGGIDFAVDGTRIDPSEQVTYRGLMITELPNFAYTFGYFRWSWTLRAELVAGFVNRLLTHLDRTGAESVVPRLRAEDADMPLLPWIDPDNANPGYMMRSQSTMYRRGDREPWTHFKEYTEERESIPAIDLNEGALSYGFRQVRPGAPEFASVSASASASSGNN
ncbi:flavin-containing monooxygenase [Pseudonocardia oroxyli]|uniref:Cyclohexanone monooxygenase n=1 Tax=Pseudonocardia oroxyli TaxID=366584 RepID=A0A1G7R2I5_PSEOR|nr:NAD(P)/FAD-dependent oxidoreductase [Pseudonocardia oroxyli]SDG04996.1 cyclohexanone monooxygenase [Pseudonocardia oroxyli]